LEVELRPNPLERLTALPLNFYSSLKREGKKWVNQKRDGKKDSMEGWKEKRNDARKKGGRNRGEEGRSCRLIRELPPLADHYISTCKITLTAK
jgi:hypothetical protein